MKVRFPTRNNRFQQPPPVVFARRPSLRPASLANPAQRFRPRNQLCRCHSSSDSETLAASCQEHSQDPSNFKGPAQARRLAAAQRDRLRVRPPVASHDDHVSTYQTLSSTSRPPLVRLQGLPCPLRPELALCSCCHVALRQEHNHSTASSTSSASFKTPCDSCPASVCSSSMA